MITQLPLRPSSVMNLIHIWSLFSQEMVIIIHKPSKLTGELAAVSVATKLIKWLLGLFGVVLMNVLFFRNLVIMDINFVLWVMVQWAIAQEKEVAVPPECFCLHCAWWWEPESLTTLHLWCKSSAGLPVQQRLMFKTAFLVFKCLHVSVVASQCELLEHNVVNFLFCLSKWHLVLYVNTSVSWAALQYGAGHTLY